MYLVFETEEKANKALNKINTNKGYPIAGRNAKTNELEPGKETIAWDIVKKIYNQDRWYIKKPEEEFIAGVVDYVEAEKQSNWDEPQEQ